MIKTIEKFNLWLLLTGAAIVTLVAGCATSLNAQSNTFSVKRHSCFLKNFSHLKKNDCALVVIMDIPVNAPKTLTDSITAFLNEELYRFFDDGDNMHLPYGTVYSTDLPNLAKHYRKAYSPFFRKNRTDICEFNTHCLDLNLVAQTDAYITYEVVWVFYGEGLEEARSWTTFVKADGHRLKEVISSENMLRFYEDYPELINFDIWCNSQWQLSEGYNLFLDNAGLLNDSMALQYFWNTGIYDDFKYDLKYIKPYLSEEARTLVSGNVNTVDVFDELGDNILGTVQTADGETVYIAALYEAVMAYTKTDRGYVPMDAFQDGGGYRHVINTWNCGGWKDSNPDSKYFVFNKPDNTLYVPKVKIVIQNGSKESESYNDRYYVYRFDGEHFVNKGEECGFWLHPSIRQFESMDYWGNTMDYQVRVDRMADGSYRLAAWKNKNDMKDTPDILVEGGHKEPGDGKVYAVWHFENEDNRFVVVDQFQLHEFQVYDKGGKLILSQKLKEVYN